MSAGDQNPFSGFVVGSIVFCPDASRLAQLGDFVASQRHGCAEQTLHLQVASLTARVRELEDLILGPEEDTSVAALHEWTMATHRERHKIRQKRGI